jgi:hypothetical protein
MGRLEPRFAIVTGFAVALAVVTFVLSELLGPGGWRGIGLVALAVLAGAPGVLLGRTGVPDAVATWGYEGAIAFVAGGVVAVGALASGDVVRVTGGTIAGGGVDALVSMVVWSWGPIGAVGYLAGVGSTLVDAIR